MPRVGSQHLSPCPVCPHSPDGYLYEREAILEYILHQKKEIARQMKVMGRDGGGTGEGQADLNAELAGRTTLGFLSEVLFPLSLPSLFPLPGAGPPPTYA